VPHTRRINRRVLNRTERIVFCPRRERGKYARVRHFVRRFEQRVKMLFWINLTVGGTPFGKRFSSSTKSVEDHRMDIIFVRVDIRYSNESGRRQIGSRHRLGRERRRYCQEPFKINTIVRRRREHVHGFRRLSAATGRHERGRHRFFVTPTVAE